MRVFKLLPKAVVLAIAAITFLTIGPTVARAVTGKILTAQQQRTVPEPVALFLIGTGLTVSAGAARRKYRRNSASPR